MFYHWLEDHNEEIELFKNHGYLIGSFSNPEAVKKLMGGNTYATSDEDFERTSQMIADDVKQQQAEIKPQKKRQRKRIKQD